jgi:short-subunit dehydrogenase
MAKTILITGAGTGFGRATAFELARRGHQVIAATYNHPQADALAADATTAGVTLKVITLDITSEGDRRKVAGSGIDVLINNAAVGESGALADAPLDRIRRTLDTNVVGTIGMIQAAVPELIARGGGTVVIVTSLAGRMPIPFLGPYGLTKYALEAVGANLAVELKPFNIRVSMIEPGAYATGFNEAQIATKYSWMSDDSIYRDKVAFIQKHEQTVMRLQSTKIDQVVRAMVTAAEAAKPKLRYAVPWWQGLGIRVMRAFGV